MKFSKDGRFLRNITDDLNVPHSLALIEALSIVCVADRENERYYSCMPQNTFSRYMLHAHTYRVVCYSTNEKTFGKKIFEIKDKTMGRVFALKYNGLFV